MKRSPNIIFIAAALILCMIPSVCMIFARSDETIGNEMAVAAPSITNKDGSFNLNILEDSGNYFEAHYAFRPQLITVDARIQANIFKVSNTDTVVTGTDGWLYYSSTVNDYIGAEQLTERGMWNLAHNISLMQEFVERKGSKFLFTSPANKNSLYGDNMPYYYSVAESNEHNRDRLNDAMENAGVNYLDLFSLFESQDEVLYLSRDSHWNNKGALLTYNAIMDQLGAAHETYENAQVSRAKIHEGDLSAMIYPAGDPLEWDYTYEREINYTYVQSGDAEVTVEDNEIDAVNDASSGKLLMYRDSFGNTLIPFIAECFASSHFSKASPCKLEKDMESNSPDYVVVEKVERNLKTFVTAPAIFSAMKAELPEDEVRIVAEDGCTVSPCTYDQSYVEFKGFLEEGILDTSDEIYVRITNGRGETYLYRASCISSDESDYGYVVYLPLSQFGAMEDAESGFGGVYTDK